MKTLLAARYWLLLCLVWLLSPWVLAQDAPMAKAEVLLGGQRFRVDVAETRPHQQRGLGGRVWLGPQEGMLFVYSQKARHPFWMKDMRIAIDILWLDNHRIVHIQHRVPPPAAGTPRGQLPVYTPAAAANMVLEIAAGRAAELGLTVGDQARLRFE